MNSKRNVGHAERIAIMDGRIEVATKVDAAVWCKQDGGVAAGMHGRPAGAIGLEQHMGSADVRTIGKNVRPEVAFTPDKAAMRADFDNSPCTQHFEKEPGRDITSTLLD